MSARAGGARRAPRLGPDELIAPHITRVGRFAKINPTKPRKLPGLAKFAGVVGWALFLGQTVRRARKASQLEDATP